MIRIPIYDTGICPRCGSRVTARLKQGRDGKSAFHWGSPVAYSHDPGTYNVMCMNCGIRWIGTGRLRLASVEEIGQLREDWESLRDVADPAEEEAILTDMSKNLWLMKEKKQVKSHSFIGILGRKVIHDTISAPAQAAKSFFHDLTGMPIVKDPKEQSTDGE